MMSDPDEDHILNYSDTGLLQRIRASPFVSPSSEGIYLISPKLVAKCVRREELVDQIAGLRLAQKLGIRVPDIKRVLQDNFEAYIIMVRIRGVTLDESWISLSWFTSIRFAFQLRRFVLLMRTQTSLTAGGLGTGLCNSIWMEDAFPLPPNATSETVTSFFKFWLQYSFERRRTPPSPESIRKTQHLVPVTPTKFVFTHQDLAPRNMMVDRDSNLWLVDWGRSGWYPIYFESASMQTFHSHAWDLMSRLRWWIFCWISVGRYGRECRALRLVRSRALRDPLARCVLQEESEHTAIC